MQHRSGAAEGGFEIVGHHDDGCALFLVEVGQRLVEVLGGGGVQAGDGFIQDQQGTGGAQGPGQQHPLLLTAGEVPVALVLELQDAQLAHVHEGRGFLGGGVEKAHALAVEAAREDHLPHGGGEVPLGPGLLGQIPQAPLPQLRGAPDLTGEGLDQP